MNNKYNIDITGLKCGKLTVVSPCKNQRVNIRWLCHCECGKTAIRTRSSLISGEAKSCGCLSRNNVSMKKINAKKLDRLKGAMSKIYRSYKNGAIRRHLDFHLTFDDVRSLTSKKCFYCGIDPKQVVVSGQHKYIYNGIDRLNNGLGYTIENSVPCCQKCNLSKLTYSRDRFYNWVKRVYNNLNINKII